MEAMQAAAPAPPRLAGETVESEGEAHQVSLQHCVVDAFWRCFTTEQNDLTLAAVHALAAVVHMSRAKTVLELFVHLRAAAEAIEEYTSREDVLRYMAKRTSVKRLTTLPLRSACSLYQQFAVRHFERKPEISVMEFKSLLIAQSAKFASRISQSKQTIADLGRIVFTKDQMVVLTHGQSSCVERLLVNAWEKHKKRFSVIITQQEGVVAAGGVGNDEEMLRASLTACGIPAVLATVGSVARLMARVDLVVVGTEAVAESGGIINRVGTATVAMVAHQNCVPFYVVCEACKFTRTHPLQQKDASVFCMQKSKHENALRLLSAQLLLPTDCQEFLDYTRPEYQQQSTHAKERHAAAAAATTATTGAAGLEAPAESVAAAPAAAPAADSAAAPAAGRTRVVFER
ncbi:hypothetical protein Efla_004762 [Eimeria flavescens]